MNTPKQIFGIAVIAAIMAFSTISCEKDTTPIEKGDNTVYTGDKQAQEGEKWCTCDCFTLTNSGGEYSCPAGEGCAKTFQKCPCKCDDVSIVEPGPDMGTGPHPKAHQQAFRVSDFIEFKEAVLNGDVRAFFGTQKWRGIIPRLIHQPEVVDKLKSGSLRIVKKSNESTNLDYFLIIPEDKVNQNFTVNDVIATVEAPSDI